MSFISRGFGGRRRIPEELRDRVPPGQYIEPGFPVLTAGPTPHVDTAEWRFGVDGDVAAPAELELGGVRASSRTRTSRATSTA